MDISVFQTYNLRTYALGAFNILEYFATPEDVKALTLQKQGFVERVLKKVIHRPSKPTTKYITEKYFHFDPDILNLTEGVYLDGYWQSEKYFMDIAEIIRQEFTVKSSQTGKNRELSEKIAACESVSLHVRRGDYVTNPHTNKVHGICGLDYYYRAIEHLTKILKNPFFFIFTDDPEWVHENLNFPSQAIIVNHNGITKDYEDLRLMTQCKHSIIANSSFSWWGAWLNPNRHKIIIAPQKWFADDSFNTKDLIPTTWVKK
jgi:hypothetical protein